MYCDPRAEHSIGNTVTLFFILSTYVITFRTGHILVSSILLLGRCVRNMHIKALKRALPHINHSGKQPGAATSMVAMVRDM